MNRFHVDPDIRAAKTPDTAIYTDPGIFREIRDRVFVPSWQFLGDADRIGDPGQTWPVTLLPGLLDEPILFTHDLSGKVHCLSNVCTHRGNLLVDAACPLTRLTCRYHGRRFGLDGSFQFMPEFEEVEGFPSEEDNLARIPWHLWGKLLFASVAPDWPATQLLAPMTDRIGWLPLQDLVYHPGRSRDYELAANWALYCENYLEGFHSPFVHAGLNAVIDCGSYTTELFDRVSLQVGYAKGDELAFDLPAGHPDAGQRVGAYYFWVFPNLMFNFYPWGLSVNVVRPMAVDRTVISFMTYVFDESKYDLGAGSDLHRVEMEDEAVVIAVQQGVRSRFYSHGRYSPTRETGTHHFHLHLTQAISG